MLYRKLQYFYRVFATYFVVWLRIPWKFDFEENYPWNDRWDVRKWLKTENKTKSNLFFDVNMYKYVRKEWRSYNFNEVFELQFAIIEEQR